MGGGDIKEKKDGLKSRSNKVLKDIKIKQLQKVK